MTAARSRTARRWMALRWMVVLAVLLLAAAVALWPRDSGGSPGAGDIGGTAGTHDAVPPSGPDLATLRARAALAPCPTPAIAGPTTTTGPDAGAVAATGDVLAGVSVTCLGDGGSVALGAALAGPDTLLNIWSHTCEPCRDELPALQDYASRRDAVAVLGVQVDGTPQAGLALLTALGVHLASVTDPDGILRAALGAPPVLPLSYLVSADGSVRMVNPPVVFRSADEVAAVVGQYLAGT